MARPTTSPVMSLTPAELIELATRLAEQDARLLHALIQARKSVDMSQSDVATALGIKQSSIAAFERHDNDPRLSTIRRYALAIGATVEHKVTPCSFSDDGWVIVASSGQVGVRAGASAQKPAAIAASSKRLDFSLAA